MKKSASPKASPKPAAELATFKQAVSMETATANCVSKLPKDFRGQNSCLNEFLKIATLLRQYQSFDLNTFLSLTRGLDLEIQEVSNLFFRWCEQMEADLKIRKVMGCYSYNTYFWNV